MYLGPFSIAKTEYYRWVKGGGEEEKEVEEEEEKIYTLLETGNPRSTSPEFPQEGLCTAS